MKLDEVGVPGLSADSDSHNGSEDKMMGFEFVCAMFADSVLTSFDFIGSSAAFSGSFEYLNDLASNSSTSFVVVAMS